MTPHELSTLDVEALTARLVEVTRALGEALRALAPTDTQREEARALGEALHRRGGFRAMLRAYESARDVVGPRDPGALAVDEAWRGVGNWLA